jgi:hypothetical protein
VIEMALKGKSLREIAHDSGRSVRAVREVLYRARKRGDYLRSDVVCDDENIPTTLDRLAAVHHGFNPSGCRWIIGDPGTPDWRWCAKKLRSTDGVVSYCGEHRKRTVVKH